jgi:hypothetical protein
MVCEVSLPPLDQRRRIIRTTNTGVAHRSRKADDDAAPAARPARGGTLSGRRGTSAAAVVSGSPGLGVDAGAADNPG